MSPELYPLNPKTVISCIPQTRNK